MRKRKNIYKIQETQMMNKSILILFKICLEFTYFIETKKFFAESTIIKSKI